RADRLEERPGLGHDGVRGGEPVHRGVVDTEPRRHRGGVRLEGDARARWLDVGGRGKGRARARRSVEHVASWSIQVVIRPGDVAASPRPPQLVYVVQLI